MRIITIQKRPYAVINGKDFAVYRWFEPDRHGPEMAGIFRERRDGALARAKQQA